MEKSRIHLEATLVPDKPWLVATHIPKDVYTPQKVNFTKMVTEDRVSKELITAGEARKKGAKVEDSVPDDKIVSAEWVERVEKKVVWTETRLCFRGKIIPTDDGETIRARLSNRQEKVREEIAAALKDPFYYVGYGNLIDSIMNEIDHWRNHNMTNQSVKPVALVVLGNDEQKGVYSRFVYFIKEFDTQRMLVAGADDDEYEIHLKEGVFDSGRLHRFVFFLPSNVELVEI